MRKAIKLLVVEDSEDDANIVVRMLQRAGFAVQHERVETAAAMASALQRQAWDAVVSDYNMPGFTGLDALRILRSTGLDIPFILISGAVGEEIAVDAIKAGANDYILKKNLARLAPVLERDLEEAAIRAAHRQAQRELVENEERFRSLTAMSSDFYWESDAEHRLTRRGAGSKLSTVPEFQAGAQLGKRRWELPYLSPDEAGWQAHRAVLDARQAFRQFAFSRLGKDGSERHILVSGDPVLDASGAFQGYRGVGHDITERKRLEEEVREALLRSRALAESANDAIITADQEGTIAGWNPAAERMFGYTEAEALGQALTLVIPERYRGDHWIGMKRVRTDGERRLIGSRVEVYGLTKAGIELPIELSLSAWDTSKGKMFGAMIHDITARRLVEAKLRRQTELYAALSECNKAIVHCATEEELFPRICRAAVQFGGMQMAWIGVVDPDTRMIRIAARIGEHADEYLQGFEISVDGDSPLGQGPAGTAIRENQPVWWQDFQKSPRTQPWHERRARFGFGSSASLPLRRNGAPIGVLTLYAAEVNAFDEAARNLLVEMATDISFALDNFARESRRKRAKKALQAAEGRFRGLVEQSIAGIYIVQNRKLAYVNPRFAEIFGYGSADEIIGCDPKSLVAEEDRGAVAERLRTQVEGEVAGVGFDFTGLRKDGTRIEIGAHGARATHDGRPAVIGLLQDISEKKRAEAEILRYIGELKTAMMSTVEVATSISELRDPYTAGHERRVAKIAAAIGAELGLDAHRQEGLKVAGQLHDIGKITVPSEILSKPGKLSTIEFQLVQGHAQAGYDVLKDVEFPWPVADVALQHHERMDGSGYPQGLKGEAIVLEARIMAVADVVEAMSSHRPYRQGLGLDAALAQVRMDAGTKLDAEVVAACERLFREKGFRLPG